MAMTRERSTSTTQEAEGWSPTSAPAGRRREAPIGNQALQRAITRRGELAVAAPDHPGEREADAVAAQVVRSLLGGGPAAPRPTQAGAAIQRKGEPGAAATTLRPAIAGEVAAGGGGRPLARSYRAPLERAFGGADFGGVRIHDDARAHALSRSLDARAFTHDRDIYFARGAFRPETRGGLHVLSHELAHVLQQGGRSRGTIHRYHAAVPASNTSEDEVSFTVSGSNVFTHQVEGEHDFLTDDSVERAKKAESERTALERPLQAKLATTAPESVALNISAGGHLAVESLGSDKKQAKAYYTSAERLQTTNEALERVRSAFRMRAVSGHTISVRTTGSRTLQKVEPENVDTDVRGTDMVSNQQCVDISKVVGGAHRTGKEREARVRDAVGTVSPELSGMRRLLGSTELGGVKEAKGKEYGSLRDTETYIDGIKDKPEGKDLVPFAAKLKVVREAIRDGLPAPTELRDFVTSFLTYQEWSEVDAFRIIHAALPESQAKNLDGLFRELLLVLQRFALYTTLKAGSSPELAGSAGINEEARPEVGDAYKISYLEFELGKWNYHWAGVVARDGDDSVTLENYTRDNAKRIGKTADPRWYFQMYGVGDQSFHRVHTGSSGVTVTQAVRTVDSTTSTTPASVTTSKEIGEAIAKARFALISGSVGRKSNADYLKCLRLLRECEAKAIEARHNPEVYRSILDLIPEIEKAATAAKSTKWFDTGTKRNKALTNLKTALTEIETKVRSALA
ncbi:MAG: DUF4157 domain-containing protein [Myxococcales bacterium]|nr:DUF4157 domain-containing protein [Myxococcales bacterium]